MEGQTITIEYRWAERKVERFPDLAAALVRSKADVIVATVAAAVSAARQATTAIPIVMVVNDPVAAGFATTLARPGGEHHRTVHDVARGGGKTAGAPQGGGGHTPNELDRAFAAMTRERAELVINLTVATALGLTIPSSLLLRADQVINQ